MRVLRYHEDGDDMQSNKKKLITKIKKKKDEVREAGIESFPASDPPASWASGPAEKEAESDKSEKKDPE